MDGRLDEEIYRTLPPANGFIQQSPRSGEPATDDTDVWILFDDDNLYISMLCHETNPEKRTDLYIQLAELLERQMQDLGGAIHVKELKLPEGVTVKADPESLVVHVTTKVAEAAPTEPTEGTQPEVIKPERKEKED